MINNYTDLIVIDICEVTSTASVTGLLTSTFEIAQALVKDT